MEEANRNMADDAPADAFQIENVKAEQSDSDDSTSSDSTSSDEEEDCDLNVQEKKKEKLRKKPTPPENRIEIDLDVFREENSHVDGRDVSVQPVDTLPVAFQQNAEIGEEKSPKKPLIEEL
uniref:Uncharacterized protein n=1 Tax=Caenorhabditis japonica TaxID=281687 RepID=A0A8R1HJ57_CAEJA